MTNETKAATIPLSGKRGVGLCAVIDSADNDAVSAYRWTAKHDGARIYCQAWIAGHMMTMHRFLLGKKDGLEIDHINGDGLDNRRVNLRFVTRGENILNRKYKTPHLTSTKIGVHYVRRFDKWVARISLGGKCVHLGYHRTEQEAINARKLAEIELRSVTDVR